MHITDPHDHLYIPLEAKHCGKQTVPPLVFLNNSVVREAYIRQTFRTMTYIVPLLSLCFVGFKLHTLGRGNVCHRNLEQVNLTKSWLKIRRNATQENDRR